MTEAKAKTKADPVINWKSFQKNTLDMLPVQALKGRALWIGIFVYIYLCSCTSIHLNAYTSIPQSAYMLIRL